MLDKRCEADGGYNALNVETVLSSQSVSESLG